MDSIEARHECLEQLLQEKDRVLKGIIRSQKQQHKQLIVENAQVARERDKLLKRFRHLQEKLGIKYEEEVDMDTQSSLSDQEEIPVDQETRAAAKAWELENDGQIQDQQMQEESKEPSQQLTKAQRKRLKRARKKADASQIPVIAQTMTGNEKEFDLDNLL